MRIRTPLFVAPVVLAGFFLMAAPAVPVSAQASGGVTETSSATYEVIPQQSLIRVTVSISIRNDQPDQTSSSGTIAFSQNSTDIAVAQAAGPVDVNSDAGSVAQSTIGSSNGYRVLRLIFPNVYYGQTRVVTAGYSISSATQATGGFQANGSYASLCAVGNGQDTGAVSVVIPDGYDLRVDNGGPLTRTADSGGKQVFSSGTQVDPKNYWTCVAARNTVGVSHSPITAGGQAFDIQGWAGDVAWPAMIGGVLASDVQKLADLTGLVMPGGTIVVAEVGNGGLNDHGIGYDPATRTVSIPQSATPSMVAHALSHIWFNSTLFKDTWLWEGLAGYSEMAAGTGNYVPCAAAPAYPGTGTPNLGTWLTLNPNSTIQDQNVSDWQYAASCAFFTSVADAIGPAAFRNLLQAAVAGERAYAGTSPDLPQSGISAPLTRQQMVDLIDEKGMVPAGVTDPGKTQQLLAGYGVFNALTLSARLDARTAYDALVVQAGKWTLPLAVREPMSNWDFATARTEMDKTAAVLDLRASIRKALPSFSMDGTQIQTLFESATTQADLDALSSLMTRMSDATGKVAQAAALKSGGHNILQMLGLVGADLDTPLNQARADLQKMDPDDAGAKAQSVIDRVNGSEWLGLLWLAAAGALIAFLVLLISLLIGLVIVPFRRRQAAKRVGGSPQSPV